MQNEYEIKKEMCEIGRRVYNRGMVAANDGNFSVKLNDHEFLCTPTGVSKGFMTPEYICKVDENGNVLQANKGFRPSSEIKMATRGTERPHVQLCHAHPLYANITMLAFRHTANHAARKHCLDRFRSQQSCTPFYNGDLGRLSSHTFR